MQAEREELQALFAVQDIDCEMIRLKKELAELPQRATVAETRDKMRAVMVKLEQVLALKKKARADLLRLTNEDESLREKQRSVQEAIDEARGDYRNLEARTKELDGCSKRRATLEKELLDATANVEKIEAVERQMMAGLEQLKKSEAQTIASFQHDSGKLKERMGDLETRRDEEAELVSPELLTLYEKTAARTGGVAVSLLKDGRCGACRSAIDGGRLVELKRNAPLGECPTCKRLLVVG